jgi:hypothetical protein
MHESRGATARDVRTGTFPGRFRIVDGDHVNLMHTPAHAPPPARRCFDA